MWFTLITSFAYAHRDEPTCRLAATLSGSGIHTRLVYFMKEAMNDSLSVFLLFYPGGYLENQRCR